MAGCIYRPYYDSSLFSRKGEERAQRNLNEARKNKTKPSTKPHNLMPAEGPFYCILHRLVHFSSILYAREMPGGLILSKASPRIYTSGGLCLSIYHGFSTLYEHLVRQRSAQQAHSIDLNIVLMFFGHPRRSGWQAHFISVDTFYDNFYA